MTERLKAAIRLIYPDDMTPTARRILLQIIEEEEAEAVANAAASDVIASQSLSAARTSATRNQSND